MHPVTGLISCDGFAAPHTSPVAGFLWDVPALMRAGRHANEAR